MILQSPGESNSQHWYFLIVTEFSKKRSIAEFYAKYGKNILSVIKNESLFFLKKKSMKSFLDRYAKSNIDENEKFVYFPFMENYYSKLKNKLNWIGKN